MPLLTIALVVPALHAVRTRIEPLAVMANPIPIASLAVLVPTRRALLDIVNLFSIESVALATTVWTAKLTKPRAVTGQLTEYVPTAPSARLDPSVWMVATIEWTLSAILARQLPHASLPSMYPRLALLPATWSALGALTLAHGTATSPASVPMPLHPYVFSSLASVHCPPLSQLARRLFSSPSSLWTATLWKRMSLFP